MANCEVPDPPRLIVLKRLTEHLETITRANGYYHDLAAAVFRGRLLFGEGDPLPMLSILEAPRSSIGEYADENNNVKKDEWQLMLQGWAADDVHNPCDRAYGLAHDVEKCLGRIVRVNRGGEGLEPGKPTYPDSYLLGGLITSLTFSTPNVRPPTEGVSSKAFFYIPLRVGLAQDVG